MSRPEESPPREQVRDQLALERCIPSLAGQLRRVSLTTLPTPVQPLERLRRERDIGELWVKRDDRSGRLYGGNKPRKLEFLLGDARARGRTSVMTFGGIGTHHGLATAICARAVGLRTLLVLIPQPVTEHVRRCLLLDYAYGAELHYAPSVVRAATTAVRLLGRGLLRRDLPAIIPTGGTSPLGAVGYVNAACELAEQVRCGALPEPRAIFVPLGSGGTVAGLVLGLRLAGLQSRVVGVLVTDILPPSASRLLRLAKSTLRLLHGLSSDVPPVDLSIGDFTPVTQFVGRCYGAPTDEGVQAVHLARELEGIELETTYTAKCFAALLALAATTPYREGPLLFWNTYSSVDAAAHAPRLPAPEELPPVFQQFLLAPRT